MCALYGQNTANPIPTATVMVDNLLTTLWVEG
ncbi:hypothetical protein SCTVLC_0560 [Serratia symbiotica SCt-VLC]|uniref:Uncharacterized protein n=1 Tax=Serratia symbiotica SCt-VLC TaxID=1347341 RepID=A0A068RAA8_9GAMM|nr:hypothetical protein SCTVLC_0560 [Serratia symbiotica SCt-VLC]